MSMSNYLETAILNATLRGIPYTPPETLYCALYVDNPTDADTATEVSGNSYARKTVTFDAPSGNVVVNDEDVVFAAATGTWGLIGYVGIRDASTGGNLLYHGELTVAEEIILNKEFRFPAGQLSISLD